MIGGCGSEVWALLKVVTREPAFSVVILVNSVAGNLVPEEDSPVLLIVDNLVSCVKIA